MVPIHHRATPGKGTAPERPHNPPASSPGADIIGLRMPCFDRLGLLCLVTSKSIRVCRADRVFPEKHLPRNREWSYCVARTIACPRNEVETVDPE